MKDYYAQNAESMRQGQPGMVPHLLGGPEIPTGRSSSPRYYGQEADKLYGKKPQDVSRELISQLQSGMSGLQHLKPTN